MRILVTGAAGFIGSHLAEHLALSGHDVIGLDCFIDNYARELKEINIRSIREKGCKFVSCDLAKDALSNVVQDVDAVFHCAAQPGLSSVASFEDYIRNNIIATHRLLETAIDTNTIHGGFIYISTSSVYGARATGNESTETKPTSYYGVTKLAAEHLVMAASRQGKIDACSLRLFSVYGPRERPEKLYPRLIECILQDKEFPLFDGSNEHYRSYTYVADALAGMVLALENMSNCNGEIFNIGSNISITTREGIRIIENLLGRQAKISITPTRSGDQLETRADIEKARNMLGYNPKTPVLEGLSQEVNWFRGNKIHDGAN
ncbi:MAG: NAD-dependent epimerase/dehydratase family protein [Anaerolineales bacterium]